MAITSYEKKIRTKKDSMQFKTIIAYRYDERYHGIHIKASGFISEAKARKALHIRKDEIDEQFPDEVALALREKRERLNVTLFENIINDFYEYKQLHVKDIRNVKEHFTNRITPFFNGKMLHQIKESDIEAWQRWLLSLTYITKRAYKENKELDTDATVYKHYSNACIMNSQIYLKEFFNFAVKKKHMPTNPMNELKKVQNKNEIKRTIQFWTLDEFNKFINKVDDPLFYTLFYTLFWTGIRIGECIALSWDDIDFANQTIRINKTYDEKIHQCTPPKTERSNRTILINKKLLDCLKTHYEDCKDYDGFSNTSYVFGIYKTLDDNTIRRKKNFYCELGEVKQIKIHELRHSHVSLLINNRFTPFEIAKRIGDTEKIILSTYAHMFSITQENMVGFLDKIA